MIRNDAEYRRAVRRIEAEQETIAALSKRLVAEGLGPDELKRALDPVRSFHLQLVEEAEAYERLQRGEFGDLINFEGIGQLLVSLRIYGGLTQRDLASRLGVHESQVSRDERNEYHGITVARATRILEVLGARISSRVEAVDPPEADQVTI